MAKFNFNAKKYVIGVITNDKYVINKLDNCTEEQFSLAKDIIETFYKIILNELNNVNKNSYLTYVRGYFHPYLNIYNNQLIIDFHKVNDIYNLYSIFHILKSFDIYTDKKKYNDKEELNKILIELMKL